MRFGRHRRVVKVKLADGDPEQLVASVRERRGRMPLGVRMRLRVSRHGRVRLRQRPVSRYNVPPHLIGRVVAARPRNLLLGEIRESLFELAVGRLFWFLAVLLGVAGVMVAAAEGMGNPGPYICLPGAALFGWLAARIEGGRAANFEQGATELHQEARALLQTPRRHR
jgi:hypothetical protein